MSYNRVKSKQMSIVQFSIYSYQTDLFQMPALHFSTVNFFSGF